jgi:hypothetical protein
VEEQVEERAVERAALRQRAAARELAAERAAERAALAERAAARAALRQQVEERRAALREVEEQAVERAALRSSSSSLPVTVGLYISHSFIRLAFRQSIQVYAPGLAPRRHNSNRPAAPGLSPHKMWGRRVQ